MRLHILVEGPSESAWLLGWLPKYLKPHHSFQIITHEGKGKLSRNFASPPSPTRRGLLDQLPAKLRAYGKSLNPDTDRVVVLVDADDENCIDLKNRIVECVNACDPAPAVLVRIAIEETEAFFLGDVLAIRKAFRKVKVAKLKDYVQDSICGTWEVLRDALGVRAGSEDKVDWAERISPHMAVDPAKNKSPSFRVFCRGLLRLCGDRENSTGARRSRNRPNAT